MKAIHNVLPHSKQLIEVVLAKEQPEYKPLPVVITEQQSMISCYELTLLERVKLFFNNRLWIEQLTFGGKLQPQRVTVNEPYTKADQE